MTDLLLHGREIRTVFDLLGSKENDITYSLGWALAQSDRLSRALLDDLFPGAEAGELAATRLQEFVAGGFTDVEVESERIHVILEAKRGWELPQQSQLGRYAPSLHGREHNALVVLSECSPEYAIPRLPSEVAGFPVLYRSWRQVTELVEKTTKAGSHAERRLLRELVRYLRGLLTMQSVRDNMVYVVALSDEPDTWSGTLTGVQIVEAKRRYFHPIASRGFPKEPPNYVGFRYAGKLQGICHIEGYDVFTDPHEHFPEIPSQSWEPHFLYRLGPRITPGHEVRTGSKIKRGRRTWIALDLLLTCTTVSESLDETNRRLEKAGQP